MKHSLALTLAAAAVLAGPIGLASSASAQQAPSHDVTPQGHRNCYSNLKKDATELVLSENFVPGGDAYDTAVAQPIALKRKCVVHTVFADGFYFRGSGNAVDETVTIYADAGGVPGSVISEQTVAGTDDASGYTIALTPVKLRPGSYWVSVVSNQAFEGGGQWGWVRSTRSKSGEAVYENPGDGWGSGCTTWTALTTCAGGDGVSMMMQIRNY